MKKILFIDVDDTLIRTYGTKQVPIVNVINKLIEIKNTKDVDMYLGSAGGAEYAKRVADKLGIANLFLAFLPKPSVYLDDQIVDQWTFCKNVHPAELHELQTALTGSTINQIID